MYATLRRIKIHPHLMEELTRMTEQEFVPVLRQEPGFIGFYVVRTGEDEAISISLFEHKEEAEEGNKKALEWAKERLFPLAKAPAEIVGVGELLLSQTRVSEGERNSL